jgi:5-methyltetrahydrofolate--homocysteine methyltransferase
MDPGRPARNNERDVVAFTIVTVGRRASEVAQEWFKANRYQDYLHLHGLGVETAEALAEYLHKQVRMELDIAAADAREVRKLFQQGYQGSRYSFGYPACPNLEDQAKLWPLLEPGRIGVALSEEFQLDPEQSTSALIAHHPEARYFNVRG